MNPHRPSHLPSPLRTLRAAQLRRTSRTATLTVVATLLTLGAVFARTAQLQLATPPALAEHISERASRLELDAPRGDIRDRRGRVLASTQPAYQLFLDPHALLRLDERNTTTGPAALAETRAAAERDLYTLIGHLAEAAPNLNADPANLANRVAEAAQRADNRHHAGRSPLRYTRLSDPLDDHALARATHLANQHHALHLQRVPARAERIPPGAAPVVGLVGFSHKGLLGAERAFDAQLAPRTGHIDYTRDATGQPLWINQHDYTMPARGKDIHLSIDAHIQTIAHQQLARAVEDANAAGGRLVIIEPNTGEVLALADTINRSLTTAPEPSLDPAVRDAYDLIPFDTNLADEARRDDIPVRFATLTPDPNTDPDNPNAVPALARNRCVEHVYEPGSTFKPFIWAAALAHNVAAPDETFDTEKGRWQTPDGRIIEDVYPHDQLTFREALVNSSNIAMIKAAHRLSPQQARTAIARFGFTTPTNLGLPGEAAGLLTDPENWRTSTQTSIAMGYEVAVTPVQMARAFATLARTGVNAGTLPALTLRAIHDTEQTTAANPNHIIRKVIDPAIAAETRDTLREVAERMLENTKRRFPDDPDFPWSIFGKSGTSKIARPDGRGYLPFQYHSSFVAAAPADNPRLVAVAIIDDPDPALARQRLAFGSQVAGPLAKRALHQTLDYLAEPLPIDNKDDER